MHSLMKIRGSGIRGVTQILNYVIPLLGTQLSCKLDDTCALKQATATSCSSLIIILPFGLTYLTYAVCGMITAFCLTVFFLTVCCLIT
jgi:hypothetical protein